MYKNSQAFTLTELLVVVLIIGILSAVALPQYQKAVVKTRYATLKPLVRAIADAERVYYMANGSYTNNFDDLDVQLPPHTSENSIMNSAGDEVRRVTRNFAWGSCYLEDKANVVCIHGTAKMRYAMNFRAKNVWATCWANNIEDNSIQNQICKAETGKSTYTNRSTESKYTTWGY